MKLYVLRYFQSFLLLRLPSRKIKHATKKFFVSQNAILFMKRRKQQTTNTKENNNNFNSNYILNFIQHFSVYCQFVHISWCNIFSKPFVRFSPLQTGNLSRESDSAPFSRALWCEENYAHSKHKKLLLFSRIAKQRNFFFLFLYYFPQKKSA